MKPFKSGTVFAAWLFRITLIWFVYEHYFWSFPGFDLHSFSFYIYAAYILCTVLILAGGFMLKSSLTALAGFILFILPIIQLIHNFPVEPLKVVMLYLIPLSIGFYFFTSGNGN